MHVLMTGGTGMIGRALAINLIEDGHEVSVLTRNPDKDTGAPVGVRLVRWDATATDGWADIVEDVDAVVHLAGESLADGRWSAARKTRIRDSRVLSGQALVKAIQEATNRPGVLVQSSAVGYYGPRKDEKIDENAGPGRDYLAHICFEWETATAPVGKLGVRRPIARTGIVLSKDGGALPRILLPFKFFAGGKIGSGNQWWSWIHIADEVRALRFLIDHAKASGPFNLSAPNPVTNKEFSATVGSAMGKPSRLPVPSPALSTLFGEMSTVLLDGQRVIPKRLQELGFTFEFPELDGALKDLLS